MTYQLWPAFPDQHKKLNNWLSIEISGGAQYEFRIKVFYGDVYCTAAWLQKQDWWVYTAIYA